MNTGITYTSHLKVEEKDTALSLGSGNLSVLATPRMIALMENAAMQCVAPYLNDADTTVGTMMNVQHLRPSKVGADIAAHATLTEEDGRRLVFKVEAYEGDTLIGSGVHERFVVNKAKFMSKLN